MSALRFFSRPACVFLATCFGVFILPFFFPPQPIQGLSAANVAGFNNKIASIAAALIGISVFAVSLRRRNSQTAKPAVGDFSAISWRFILIVTAIGALAIAAFSVLIVRSGFRYTNDAYYFMNQISMHTDFGRKLYDQIEFPYGPLLFYSPIFLRTMLSPFHVSAEGAYFATLVIAHIIGLLMVGWTINGLPILHRWRTLLFLVCALHMVQPCFGLNYTYLRFFTPAPLLMLAARQQRLRNLVGTLFIGQLICLSISPEIGFAFLAGATTYAACCVYTKGRPWLLAVAAPLLATPLFLLLAGGGYVRMLGLFAKGVLNFIVEPQPYILLFLYALIWLVPPILAIYFRQMREQAPLMVSFYIVSLSLLPVAFGRADPGHVFLNEIPLYILSMVAISWQTPRRQNIWAACVGLILVWSSILNVRAFRLEYQTVIRKEFIGNHAAVAVLSRLSPATLQRQYDAERDDHSYYLPLDLPRLQQIVGTTSVATPLEVTIPIERSLRQAGLYRPSFYCYLVAVLDRDGELRKIEEMNSAQWALLPYGAEVENVQTPESTANILGLRLPYRQKNPPFHMGRLFNQNLATNWQPWERIGLYQLYKRK